MMQGKRSSIFQYDTEPQILGSLGASFRALAIRVVALYGQELSAIFKEALAGPAC